MISDLVYCVYLYYITLPDSLSIKQWEWVLEAQKCRVERRGGGGGGGGGESEWRLHLISGIPSRVKNRSNWIKFLNYLLGFLKLQSAETRTIIWLKNGFTAFFLTVNIVRAIILCNVMV